VPRTTPAAPQADTLRTAPHTKPPATESNAPLAEDQSNTARSGLEKVNRIAMMESAVINGQITKAFTPSFRNVTRLTSFQEVASQRDALPRKCSNDSEVPSRVGKNTTNKSRKPRQIVAPMKTTATVIRAVAER
jgi:hypothetical protein